MAVDSVDLISLLKRKLDELHKPLGDLKKIDQDETHLQTQFYMLLVNCLELKLKILNCRREEEIIKTCEILQKKLLELEERNLEKLREIKKYKILGLSYDQVAKEYLKLSKEKERLKLDLIRLEG
jgi:hypothetical protein